MYTQTHIHAQTDRHTHIDTRTDLQGSMTSDVQRCIRGGAYDEYIFTKSCMETD